VIHDFPIWLAETARIPTLALPDETPADVLDLASDPRFGAKWLIVAKPEHGAWPAILDGSAPGAACFHEVALPVPEDPADAAAIAGMRVFRIGCDAASVRPAPAGAPRPSP
jgi:hypothetical protein